MHPPTVAVIGAGFSGTVLSLRLQATAPPGTRILLIEVTGRFGPGLAYGAAGPNHLLNVPAGRMSPFPDRPRDFVLWLKCQPRSRVPAALAREETFVPRRLYGDYLAHLLAESCRKTGSTRVELLQEQVVSLDHGAREVALRFASGGLATVSLAVLATGNAPPLPPHPAAQALLDAGLWQGDPWHPATLNDIDRSTSVLLVGTGLTMVDKVMSLLDAGHSGPIRALSRHGLLPRPHLAQAAPNWPLRSDLPSDINGLLRALRQEAARALAAGQPWQVLMDSLRPVTPALWRAMGETDRRRFLRHLRTYWDTHRHRLPPQIAARLAASQARGQLQVRAGRIAQLTMSDGEAVVAWCPRGCSDLQTMRVARVVNCSGPAGDPTRTDDPLVRSLLRAGVARPDPVGLGLDVTLDGALRSPDGRASDRLYAIGPLARGAWWETTAVPDIRRECEVMAQTLGRRLRALTATTKPPADPDAATPQRWRITAPQLGLRHHSTRNERTRPS